jgi:hydroxymethylpyrimidine pyrophosphatase-like HAD family hydrolase
MYYQTKKTVFVDVDNTLVDKYNNSNKELIKALYVSKANGFEINLWSMRGEEYAKEVADRLGITDLFNNIISKPGYIADDMGWKWIQYTKRFDWD